MQVIFPALTIDKLIGLQETEFNEFMLVGLGLGVSSIVAIGMIIYCRRHK